MKITLDDLVPEKLMRHGRLNMALARAYIECAELVVNYEQRNDHEWIQPCIDEIREALDALELAVKPALSGSGAADVAYLLLPDAIDLLEVVQKFVALASGASSPLCEQSPQTKALPQGAGEPTR